MADLRASDVLGPLLFCLLITLGGQLSFAVPGSPVPVSLQTFFLMVAGLTMGAGKGAVAAMMLLALGALGLPVFADGAGGLSALTGPTGGYLAGFPVGAYLAGWLTFRKGHFCWKHAALGAILGQFIVLLIGVPRLAMVIDASFLVAAQKGALPYLPGLFMKAVGAALAGAMWHLWRDGGATQAEVR